MNFRTEAEAIDDGLRELTRAADAYRIQIESSTAEFGTIDDDSAERRMLIASAELQGRILFAVANLSVTVRDLLRALPAETVD